MTGQIPDSVVYRDDAYSLTGVNGDGLFSPDSLGLTVQMLSTGCWRGYVCDYKVSDGALTLTGVDLGLCDESQQYLSADSAPELFGVRPTPTGHADALRYNDFSHPIDFTGGLLIGREFDDDYYVHMGFQAGWKYGSLYELLFEQGRLIAEHERSAAAAARRAQAMDDSPHHSDKEGIRRWVRRSFDQSYDPF